MRLFLAIRARCDSAGIHPVLRRLSGEYRGTLARLAAYVSVLALLALIGIQAWDELRPDVTANSAKASWIAASRSHPAFAVSQFDLPNKTEAYDILRHPEGGRKDVIRWAVQGENPIAELEVYRPGDELGQAGPAISDIANRMDPGGVRELQAAGVIDSKFGMVTLLGLTDDAGSRRPCLGFLKRLDQPNLRISGWSCQGDSVPARRAAIGCILDRLILLTAGNDPKLADLFARAELRRGRCASAATGQSMASKDWVTNAQNPRLRGSL